MTGIEDTIGTFFAHKISDFAEAHNKQNILEEISIYGLSNEDNSHVMSFEWNGMEEAHKAANDVLGFLEDIKKIVVESGKEAKEQLPPHVTIFKDIRRADPNVIRILYRVRVWNAPGEYVTMERKLETK